MFGPKALIRGGGSIATRHGAVLQRLGFEVVFVTCQKVADFTTYPNLNTALEMVHPDYVVICSPTASHHEDIVTLSLGGFSGKVLVEKPLFHSVLPFPANKFKNIGVGYNLRFHPIIPCLRKLLKDQKILSTQLYVGQYLPDWRPGRDYRETYSAKTGQGGGALLDLSHDLDYLQHLIGAWTQVTAKGGKYSGLEIDSDDLFGLLFSSERSPVNLVQLNYTDRSARREVIFNCDESTVKADFIRGDVTVNGKRCGLEALARNEVFEKMHQDMFFRDQENVCKVEDALCTLKLIEASRYASKHDVWVKNENTMYYLR